jgi:hypothetical protein
VELDSAVVAGGAVAAVSGIGVGGQNGPGQRGAEFPDGLGRGLGKYPRLHGCGGWLVEHFGGLTDRACLWQVDRPGLQFGQRVGQLRGQPGRRSPAAHPRCRGKVQYRGDLVGGKLIQVGGLTQAGESG